MRPCNNEGSRQTDFRVYVQGEPQIGFVLKQSPTIGEPELLAQATWKKVPLPKQARRRAQQRRQPVHRNNSSGPSGQRNYNDCDRFRPPATEQCTRFLAAKRSMHAGNSVVARGHFISALSRKRGSRRGRCGDTTSVPCVTQASFFHRPGSRQMMHNISCSYRAAHHPLLSTRLAMGEGRYTQGSSALN